MASSPAEKPPQPPATGLVSQAMSNDTLATLLDQSLDCIKLIGLDGTLQYMNRNGLCAMEIDAASSVLGRSWEDLWPEEAQPLITDALERAAAGEAVRFDAFCPTAKGTPRWWDVSCSQVRDGLGEVLGYLSVSRDVTAARTAREVAEIASAEMRHRLKNSYAMVAGLLASLARGLPEREEFAREVRDRLSALGVAQTLFVARDNAPCNLRELLPALLQPFGHRDCSVRAAQIADVTVEQGHADALALVLGELAVNSSKHGALSAAGTIEVSALAHEDRIEVRWIERSSRAVRAHDRSGGQGLRLMQRILAARKGGIRVDWAEFGLDATIRLSLAG
ncbi:MAG TPA: PAS domain-containing protein [Allosphingosinicella sp.]|nr:PAS domain-containing protein [Allosphingosinicella sp.]